MVTKQKLIDVYGVPPCDLTCVTFEQFQSMKMFIQRHLIGLSRERSSSECCEWTHEEPQALVTAVLSGHEQT